MAQGRRGKLGSVDTTIQDDGANASEYNVKKVVWLEDRVEVTLQASEMEDKKIVIGISPITFFAQSRNHPYKHFQRKYQAFSLKTI